MSDTASPENMSTAAPKRDSGFLGQPRALATVFTMEMWERFSFYGLQGVLLFYLYFSVADGGLGINQAVAAGIVGAYGGFVYLSTIVGAWIADRLLGAERVLYFSAIVIMLGHISLAVVPRVAGLTIALILIALGSGGLKATAATVVGTLYSANDNRRDAGFSLFYLGVNIGSFFGPILTGFLQSKVGFHWAFGAAAIGMGIGLLIYSFGRRKLPSEARVVANPLPQKAFIFVILGVVVAVGAIVALVVAGIIRADNIATVLLYVVSVAVVVYFVVILSSRKVTPEERSRVFAFIPLFVTSVAFWALYMQQFTVVVVYADERLNRSFGDGQIPAAWVNSINPIFILLLSGVAAAVWTKLGDRQPSTPAKFGIGTIIMGLAFWLFLPFANSGPAGSPLFAIWLILFVFTIAELLVSPVGLSVTTKLAPRAFHTQMIALFYLSISLGSSIAGVMAMNYNPTDEIPYFSTSGLVAIVIGALLVVLTKPLLRLMRGVR